LIASWRLVSPKRIWCIRTEDAVKKTSLTLLFVAGSLAALGSPAGADSVKFYQGGSGYTGPFNQGGSVYAQTQAN
jgi:hypothetical protein